MEECQGKKFIFFWDPGSCGRFSWQGLIGFGQSSSHNSLILGDKGEKRILKHILISKLLLGEPTVCPGE